MKNKRLEYLLNQYLGKAISTEGEKELFQLIEDDANDAAVKDYMANVWSKANTGHQLSEEQSQKILSVILNEQPAKVRSIFSHTGAKKMMWAAASVIIIISSLSIYFFRNNNQPKQTELAKASTSNQNKNDILPGSAGALLTLANGSVIVLDSAGEGNVASQGNTNILKAAGTVQYITQHGVTEAALTFNTMTTPRGRQFKLVLEDGTKVWLNAESSIHFPTVFGKKQRNVDITGEAYFEVAKNSNRPFTVSVNGMQVQVLGTHFNINAYGNEPEVRTTLLEGSVKVIKNNQMQMLVPGQQARLNNSNELSVIKNVNTGEIVAWKDELFSFNDTDIKSLVRQISRWYDVELEFEIASNAQPLRFTGKISRNVPLSTLLKMLQLTGDVSFLIEGKKVTVKTL
ncbi:MAG: FecR domain-containing protein [Ferruginibacter sp.]